MNLRATIRAGLDSAAKHVARTYARTHPWFGVDDGGNTFYKTSLFTELDDIFAEIEQDADGKFEPEPPRAKENYPVVEVTTSGTAVDQSRSMDEWQDGPLAKAAREGAVLVADELN